MTVSVIGFHCNWEGCALPSALEDRFVASVGFLAPQPAQRSSGGGTVLAATGKPRGWMPVDLADGSRLLFCGHIDNRADLARQLGLAPRSDEALYAAAYDAWGERAEHKVVGQFASIIVRPDGQQVRLSRSPICAPPILYHADGERLIAASLANAIFATGELERRADREKIADGLFGNPRTAERTYFQNVRRLACGYTAIITQAAVKVSSHYDFSAIPAVRFKDDRDYVAAAKDLLQEGVAAALNGFSKPAISLSGGYDSQIVAALMARHRPGEPIEAFTAVPEYPAGEAPDNTLLADERPHVEALREMYPSIRPHWIRAEGLDLDHKQASIFAAGGVPGPGILGPWTHEIFRQAGAGGCDVMIEAVGGNASFSFGSHGVLAGMAATGNWLRLWRQAGHLARTTGRTRAHVILAEGFLPFAPDALYLKLARRFRPHLAPDPFAVLSPLNRDFAARTGVWERAARSGFQPVHRMPRSTLAARAELLSDGIEDGAEGQQAFELLYRVPVRDPSYYRPLVEFCLGIPDDQYLRNGEVRWLARRMLRGLVPDVILDEPRRAVRATDWHIRLGRQREALLSELDYLSGNAELADMIDVPGLRKTLAGWSGEFLPIYEDARLKYALLNGVMAARLVRFIDGIN